MKLWYDYDEAAAATGYKPATIKFFCDTGRLGYIVRWVKCQARHFRYRVIPSAEIVRLQTDRVHRRIR